MQPKYRNFLHLQLLLSLLLLLLPFALTAKPKAIAANPDLHVKPAVRTVSTNGYRLTEGGHVGRWLLHILIGNRFACGASYYSPLFVLTSASCLHRHRKRLDTARVELVGPDLDDSSNYALIESVNVPKGYRYPDNYMDIAVVKLRRSLQEGEQHFVTLCQQPLRSYEKLTVVACGVDPTDSTDRTSTEDVALMEKRDCQPMYEKHRLRISETIACAREFNRGRYRMYEFGCPVTAAGDQLCGIVAWGPQIGGAHPGLFTDIYQVKGFISRVVKGMQNDSRRLERRTRRRRPKLERSW
ncbi:seminase-like [Drosophila subobscura]|uniref:seminase-like n=1 Tax=Drosophila subobscura TaxID=7241 RepID=UPI00155A3B0F|nr:seminase-like [Drosophila subobscura]